MPAKYEAIRDRKFEEKKAAWKQRNPDRAMSATVRRKLYDNAQTSAARIFNATRKPGEKPVTGRH